MRGSRSCCCLTRPRTARRRPCALCPRRSWSWWRLVALSAHSLRQQTLRRGIAERHLDGGRSASRRRALVVHVDAAAENSHHPRCRRAARRCCLSLSPKRGSTPTRWRRCRHRRGLRRSRTWRGCCRSRRLPCRCDRLRVCSIEPSSWPWNSRSSSPYSSPLKCSVGPSTQVPVATSRCGAGAGGAILFSNPLLMVFLRLSGSSRGWRILATQHSIPW